MTCPKKSQKAPSFHFSLSFFPYRILKALLDWIIRVGLSMHTLPFCVPQTFCSVAPRCFTTVLIDAQLKVATPHRPQQARQPLDKHGERLSHLATHRDNDGVRQRVCGSLSQTQTHTKLAGLWRWGTLYLALSGRWSPSRDVTAGSTRGESSRPHVCRFSQQLVLSLNATSLQTQW